MDKGRHQYIEGRKGEKGNILFLILITISLYAALSYSVMQATRGNSTDADAEVSLILNSAMMQYTVAIRGALLRMLLKGTDITKLEFNPPNEFNNCTLNPKGERFLCVFHPDGGGTVYWRGPDRDVMAAGEDPVWVYNGENEVHNIGTTTPGDASSPDTSDVIAFVEGLSQRFCLSMNGQVGIPAIPVETGIIYTSASYMKNPDGSTPTSLAGTGATIGSPNGINVNLLDGIQNGCFEQDGKYIYYHVLIER